jgi:dUTP pyrophosphatase
MKIKFKKLLPDVRVPFKKIGNDMCYDLYAATDAMPVLDDEGNPIEGIVEYNTGLAMQIIDDENDGMLIGIDIRPRSSVYKTGLSMCNCVPTIDRGYTGPIKIKFYNILPQLKNYEKGDRIAQMKVGFTVPIEFEEVDELDETERGDGGFGHTGLK